MSKIRRRKLRLQDPTSLSNPGSAFPQICERNRYILSVNRSVKSQTFERAPQPPEATAPPRSMKRVIGPSFSGVNEVFPEKSFFCHVIEKTELFLIFALSAWALSPISPGI